MSANPTPPFDPALNFVMLANDWKAGVDNPTSKHRIAVELARQGHRVLWVEGTGMRRPTLGGANRSYDRRRMVLKLQKAAAGLQSAQSRVWSLAPLALPFPNNLWAYRFNNAFYGQRMARAARRLGFQVPVLINYVPTFDRLMKSWPGPVIYHCVDRWDAFETYDGDLMRKRDAGCCLNADLVLATSNDLVNRCRRLTSSVNLLSHGVDFDHFRTALTAPPKPADLPPGPVVGFFGLLSPWVDQQLLVQVADALPSDASLVLIGRWDTDVSGLHQHPRIHLLGPKPFFDLPAYLAHFRVGLIPFHVNELTLAVNPIKLREMLAAGCPVVTTDLPETRAYYQQIDIATDAQSFVDAVLSRCRKPMDADARLDLSQKVRNETWTAKVKEIVRHARALQTGDPLTDGKGLRE